MACKSIQNNPSSSSSLSPAGWIYDVFLSFRGKDTRKNFISNLFNALDQKGIKTVKDDLTLQMGQKIEKIFTAIERSRFSIIVFSEEYASSRWCLNELVKSLECMEVFGQTVLPIFYEVDPSNVRHGRGSYGKALAKHERFKDSAEKVKKWKSALTNAADLVGWDSRNSKDDAQLIEEIVRFILQRLPHRILSSDENLVGIDSHVKEISSMLSLGFQDVRVVGIWGMGGIGKTTIAKAVYDQISSQFEGCCFLENVKEGYRKHLSPTPLRNEHLSQILLESSQSESHLGTGSGEIKDRLNQKKVLIVLDNVDHMEQLESLAGNRDWFGEGSRVIVTARDKHILTAHGVNDIYEVKTLNCENALQLFSRYALKQNYPTEEFVCLSRDAISYARGLPLALKVLGSSLFGRTVHQWIDKLKALKRFPNSEIQNVLRISFDELQRNEKEIFLDIACFFKGEDKGYVTKILDSCGFFPISGMEVLIEKSLISVSSNKVQMHDLLQEMGWEIVRNESIKEPGERSRLWNYEDVYHVLMKKTGTQKVEGIVLDLSKSEQLQFSTEVFAKMNNLRLLVVCNMDLSAVLNHHSRMNILFGSVGTYEKLTDAFEQAKHCKVQLFGNFEFISPELRCLYWHGYPLKSLPLNFSPRNLCELDMSYSHVEQLWEGRKCLDKLEFIDLSHCQSLKKTPNFEGVPNLKRLILECCTGLIEVHPSIGDLKGLVFLSFKDCENLKNISSSIALESLEVLILSGCSKLKKFPDIVETMEPLVELRLDGTAIEELPSSIRRLISLSTLNLRRCENLASLPHSMSCLKSLRILNLDGCLQLKQLPENFGDLENLEELDVGGTSLTELPSSIVRLQNLKQLYCHGCKGQPPNAWQSLLWSLGSPRKFLELEGLSFSAFSGFHKLESLDLSDCNISEGAIPSDIGLLSSLTNLNLSSNNFVSIPESFNLLSNLENLALSYCKQLQSLPELPASIQYVNAQDCMSLETISGACLRQKWNFQTIFLTNCSKMARHQGIQNTVLNLLKSQSRSLLRRQFLGLVSHPFACIEVLVPGTDIPGWFIHQSSGSSLQIELPPFGLSNAKLMGLAVCAVFTVHAHLEKEKAHWLDILVQCNDGGYAVACNTEFYAGTHVESDHIWLCYASCERLSKDWPENSSIGVSFRHDGQGMGVRKFGVRFIYDVDAEESSETWMNLSSSPSVNLSGDSDESMEEDTPAMMESYPVPQESSQTRVLNYFCNFFSFLGLTCLRNTD